MKNIAFFIITALAVLFAACNSSQKQKTESHNHEASHEDHAAAHKSEKDCNHVHWSHHNGQDGPENWKNLCDNFLSCGGQAQSPINISDSIAKAGNELNALQFNYSTTSVDIINNGHTIQFNTSGENSITINDKKYDLLQFHFHALSEHTLNGEHAPVEAHFVHKHSDTDFAVLGVLFTEGNTNKLLANYLENFPQEKDSYSADESVQLMSLFPKNLSYYYYSGSLTTPPCSEVVSWYLLKEPVEATKEQIESFSEMLHENYRPVMPLNERPILSFNVK